MKNFFQLFKHHGKLIPRSEMRENIREVLEDTMVAFILHYDKEKHMLLNIDVLNQADYEDLCENVYKIYKKYLIK